jgi:hypothetical protein
MGQFAGDRNGFGVLGISPDAIAKAASIFGGPGSSGAIRHAADHLNAGDIILIELHRPGPRFNFAQRADQRGYIAIEWWPDDLDAIRYAVARGIVVVEAAGNGAENFDDPLYNVRPAGFPSSWKNPLNPANPSSHAVLVGAGAPPSGNHGPDRSRLDFSNFGARLDAQGWGREVTTTGGRGYNPGDLQGGSDETLWYTTSFSGTSSASPIVTGALACIQGILRARGLPRLSSIQARKVLRATGSPQQNAPGRPASQRIGNRPDIRAAIANLAPVVMQTEVNRVTSITSPIAGNTSDTAMLSGRSITSPMAAGFRAPAAEAITAVQSGIATRYYDECVAYPLGGISSLWLYVDNAWRAHDNPSPATKDMVQRAFLGSGSTVQVWYDNTAVVGIVVNGS